jgi:PadR family transcriptional regulator, regulatory protein PadR
MEQRQQLGSFEEIVLLAVIRLGDNAYGVTISRAIGEATGKEPSIGAIYTTLERLEEKGFVSPRQGEPTPERGGRAKRYYSVTGAGQRVLDQAEWTRSRLRLSWNQNPEPAGGGL